MDAATLVKINAALFTFVLPLGAVVGVAVTGLRLGRGAGDRRPALAGLAVTAGLLTALVGVGGVPPLPPVDTLHWIPFATAATFAVLSVIDLRPVPRADLVAGALAAVALALTGWLVLRPLLDQAESGAKWAAGDALLLVAPWLAFDRAVDREPGAPDVAALAVAAGGGALAALLAASALVSQLLGAVAVVLTAAAALAWRRPALTPGPSALGAAYVTLAGLVLYARGYTDLPVASALLVLAAPRAAAVLARRLTGLRALATAAAAMAVPAAVAVWLAHASTAEPPGGDPDLPTDYDYNF